METIHLFKLFCFSVGFIGYPNVGKSSIINTLKKKKVCKTAPIPGETKVWQYVTLMKKIYLIDCPGVVYPTGDTETEIVLKSVVRVENLKQPSEHIEEVLNRVKVEYIQKTYNILEWTDVDDFLEKFCKRSGRLLKVIIKSSFLNPFVKPVTYYFFNNYVLQLKLMNVINFFVLRVGNLMWRQLLE